MRYNPRLFRPRQLTNCCGCAILLPVYRESTPLTRPRRGRTYEERRINMKQLTRHQALVECVSMWKWLANHPSSTKYDYFVATGKADVSCSCFACAYNAQQYRLNQHFKYCRSRCIITWPGGGCSESTSPYARWLRASTNYSKRKYARQIVQLAQKALAKLESKEGKNKLCGHQ